MPHPQRETVLLAVRQCGGDGIEQFLPGDLELLNAFSFQLFYHVVVGDTYSFELVEDPS